MSSSRVRRVQPELAAHPEGTVDAKRSPLRRRSRPSDLSSVGPSAEFTALGAFDAPSHLGQEPLHLVPDEGAALSAEDRLPVGVMDRRVNGRRHILERNRLKSVLASLGDAVVAVDHAGRTLATNPAYDRLFGPPDAEIRPEDLAGLPLPPREWPQQRAARGERFRMATVDQILGAVKTVAAGGTAFPAAARQAANDALRVPTPRELEILAVVAEGASNAEIAERLSLRVKAVESQLRRLFDRYDVTSRTALVRLAAQQGWSEEGR